MDLQKYFEGIQQVLSSSAHVRTVFGDPISAEGKTIIPKVVEAVEVLSPNRWG